jgi:hypothetical protein
MKNRPSKRPFPDSLTPPIRHVNEKPGPGEPAPGSFVNLDRLTAVRFGSGDGGEVTAICEAAGSVSRRYEGVEAVALREALQSRCCHSTSEEWSW